jgi:hypothetical protein
MTGRQARHAWHASRHSSASPFLEPCAPRFYCRGRPAKPDPPPHDPLTLRPLPPPPTPRREAAAGPQAMDQEDEVRAPLPVRTERLYGEEPAYRPHGRRHAANPVPHNVVDAFRDFRWVLDLMGGGGWSDGCCWVFVGAGQSPYPDFEGEKKSNSLFQHCGCRRGFAGGCLLGAAHAGHSHPAQPRARLPACLPAAGRRPAPAPTAVQAWQPCLSLPARCSSMGALKRQSSRRRSRAAGW